MRITILREKPETKAFRRQILRIIGPKKATAYDITKVLYKKSDPKDQYLKLYKKVLYHLGVMEKTGQVKFIGEEVGDGPLPKRVYRRGKK